MNLLDKIFPKQEKEPELKSGEEPILPIKEKQEEDKVIDKEQEVRGIFAGLDAKNKLFFKVIGQVSDLELLGLLKYVEIRITETNHSVLVKAFKDLLDVIKGATTKK
jgi:hypothetical protein